MGPRYFSYRGMAQVESTAETLLAMPPTVVRLFQSVIDEDLTGELNPAEQLNMEPTDDAARVPFKVWERGWRDKFKKSVGDATDDSAGGSMCDTCLLYTSPSPRDATLSRMPSSA